MHCYICLSEMHILDLYTVVITLFWEAEPRMPVNDIRYVVTGYVCLLAWMPLWIVDIVDVPFNVVDVPILLLLFCLI